MASRLDPDSFDSFPFSWPDDKTGPWRIRVHIDHSTGVARLVGIDIRSFAGRDPDPADPPRLKHGELREVTTSDLRALSLPKVMAKAVKEAGKMYDQAAKTPRYAERLEWLDERRERYAQSARRYDLDHYRSVAAAYTEALSTGEPTKAVAEQFKLTRSAAAKHVARCRELGFLEETRPGRAGGAARKELR